MSTKQYDLEETYTVEDTGTPYDLISFADGAAAESILEKFSEEKGSYTLEFNYLAFETPLRAELAGRGRNFSGAIYLGEETILATPGTSEDIQRIADEVLTE